MLIPRLTFGGGAVRILHRNAANKSWNTNYYATLCNITIIAHYRHIHTYFNISGLQWHHIQLLSRLGPLFAALTVSVLLRSLFGRFVESSADVGWMVFLESCWDLKDSSANWSTKLGLHRRFSHKSRHIRYIKWDVSAQATQSLCRDWHHVRSQSRCGFMMRHSILNI